MRLTLFLMCDCLQLSRPAPTPTPLPLFHIWESVDIASLAETAETRMVQRTPSRPHPLTIGMAEPLAPAFIQVVLNCPAPPRKSQLVSHRPHQTLLGPACPQHSGHMNPAGGTQGEAGPALCGAITSCRSANKRDFR